LSTDESESVAECWKQDTPTEDVRRNAARICPNLLQGATKIAEMANLILEG